MNWEKWMEGAYWVHDFVDRKVTARQSREKLANAHQRKFRRLVRYIWRHSPFYRSLMEQRRLDPETCQVGDFPELTKQDLVEHFDEMVTDRRLSLRVIRDFHERN